MYYVDLICGLTGIIFIIFMAWELINKASDQVDDFIAKRRR